LSRYNYLLIFVVFLVPTIGSSQVRGYVLNQDNIPIGNALIQNSATENWTISNNEGYFFISKTPRLGDTLRVHHYGYHNAYFIYQDDRPKYIILNIDPVILDSVTVQSQFKVPQIDFQISSGSDPFNINQTLNSIPNVYIRSYGGSAGSKFLNLDGSASAHTKILFGEIELTNPQNGETDLSQIPTPFFNHIKIIDGSSLSHTSGAMSGVVKIDPWQDKFGLTFGLGSHGFSAFHGDFPIHKKTIFLDLLVGFLNDAGDYSVDWNNEKIQRENNGFLQKYWALRFRKLFAKTGFVAITILDSYQDRGVAGLIWSPSSEARRIDRLSLNSISFGWFLRRSILKINYYTNLNDEKYSDPNYSINSHHRIKFSKMSVNLQRTFSNDSDGHFILGVKQSKLSSTDAGDRAQNILDGSANFRTRPVSRITLNPSVGFEYIVNGLERTTASFTVSASNSPQSTISYSVGTGFRFPTLNDLYWEPGGNPDLKTERSIKHSMFVKHSFSSQLQLILNAKYLNSRQLIQWVPGAQIWQPQNVARTRSLSFSMKSIFQFKRLPIQISGHFNLLNTRDLTINKPLRYAPHYSGTIALNYAAANLQTGLQIHFNSSQIINYDWPKDLVLDPYNIVAGFVQYKPRVLFTNMRLQLSVENITDKNYMTIYGYPEPGRTIRLILKYEHE